MEAGNDAFRNGANWLVRVNADSSNGRFVSRFVCEKKKKKREKKKREERKRKNPMLARTSRAPPQPLPSPPLPPPAPRSVEKAARRRFARGEREATVVPSSPVPILRRTSFARIYTAKASLYVGTYVYRVRE